MSDIGQMNHLKVVKQVPFGVYLDGGRNGEILLPTKFVPNDCKVGDLVNVFLYFDSEDQLIATTQRPRATVGKFAYLEVKEVSKVGAFLDWGLQKDLLVPFPMQRRRMQAGKSYIVYVTLDEQGRIVATSKIDKYLDRWPANYKNGEEVSLLIAEQSDIGRKAIVNDRHWGVLYEDEIFKDVRYGKRLKGYIKQVREDGKLDLTLNKPGRGKIADLAEQILVDLQSGTGHLALHDKSPAEDIYKAYGQSKKTFKSAIGQLYKKRLIVIEDDGIRLAD